MIITEQVKVLRVAKGREHSAKVGGAVLQDKGKRQVPVLSGGVQNEPTQWQKRQQSGVVGQQHGANQCDEDQGGHDATGGVKQLHQLL